MPSFPGRLKRGKTPVDAQLAQYPPPPHWTLLRWLNWITRKSPATPGKIKLNVEVRPLDILRAHGDTTETPTFGHDLILTYSVLGGLSGDFNNPVTMRPWPVKVNNQGSLHTIAAGITRADEYESSVVTGTPVTATFQPAPSKTILMANDGTATVTVQFTAHYYPDNHTPDFRGIQSLSFPAGFVTTIQGEFVGALISTTSGTTQPYRLWTFS